MARKSEARSTPRSDARQAIAKAVEFAEAAAAEIGAGRWNAAGLQAIHSGIAAGDAALIASAGLRSVSQDHGRVVAMLDEQVPEFRAAQGRHLTGLLKMKNTVEYEQRLLTETEARQLVDHARKLLTWSKSVMDQHVG